MEGGRVDLVGVPPVHQDYDPDEERKVTHLDSMVRNMGVMVMMMMVMMMINMSMMINKNVMVNRRRMVTVSHSEVDRWSQPFNISIYNTGIV